MDSYRFYLGARAFTALCWATMVTLNLVFMVEVAGLDPLQMVLVGTALEAAVFVFEIPTGVVADTLSRRLSVIIGHGLMGVGFLIVVLWPSFLPILLAQIVWGFGYTFISGAYPAWLTSEVGVTRANEAFLRGSQLAHIASFAGIGLAVGLAHISLALPIVVGACGYLLLAGGMALLMREDHFEPAADRASWRAMRTLFVAGMSEVRSRPVLIGMLLITALIGMFSEGIDRLYTPFLIEQFEFPALGALDGVAWWGIIAAVSSLLGLIATTVARARVDLENQLRLTHILAGTLLGVSLSVLLLANASSFALVLVCYWLARGLQAAYEPLVSAWLNRLLPEASRATLFSIYGQADAFGQTVGGPVIGLLAKVRTISFALGTSAFILVPALPIFSVLNRRLSNSGSKP